MIWDALYIVSIHIIFYNYIYLLILRSFDIFFFFSFWFLTLNRARPISFGHPVLFSIFLPEVDK